MMNMIYKDFARVNLTNPKNPRSIFANLCIYFTSPAWIRPILFIS